ncbi:MAG: carboxypeptidase-like regulatory domain-containing protein, partial [Cytophagales bacterium]|nr:carboxypeptidase-like regulatory domain-containing protein [Cytophagales bacterium]
MVRRFVSTLFFSLFSLCLLAQTGSIKGTIKDAKTGDALIGATVLIEGTTTGAAADIEGNFLISKAPAGAATLTVSFLGYQAKKINVQVESGKTTVVNTALDEDAGQALAEVVVVAERPTNTEVSLISEIKTAQTIATGVSAEQIVRTQDRDAAQVARRVPGVSIVDNRFVLVRGLTQRYNTVLINDVISPSTEVDIRSFSFDMIPSNMLDRMVIYKNGAAELPGEFAGGVIKVYTKKAPEENFFNVGASVSYRPATTFETVQKSPGGRLDFLGFDNSDRALPGGVPGSTEQFRNLPSAERAALLNQMPYNFPVSNYSVPLDYRLNLNLGRRFDWGGVRVGNLTGINYTYANQAADVAFNTYNNGNTAGDINTGFNDQTFTNSARLGILHNWLFRFNPNFSIEFKNLFNQLGTFENVVRTGVLTGTSQDILSYSQRFESRSIYTGQLVGNNTFGERTSLNWQLGFSNTRRTEPDWRRALYVRPSGSEEPFSVSVGNEPLLTRGGRFFSELNENVFTAAANLERSLGKKEGDNAAKLKAGFYTERKDRRFDARFFGYVNGTTEQSQLPIDQVFRPENVTGTELDFAVQEEFNPLNSYSAANTLLAGYTSLSLPLGEKLNATVGFRGEFNQQELSSQDRSLRPITVDKPVFSPLPSVNLSYNLSDKQLVRLAYAYTVNRPEFRELAPFIYFDYNINATVQGNRSLKTANIQNLDARWEFYPSPSELVSFGVFYKYFTNPIESYLLTLPGSVSYTFVNAQKATSYGVEAEVRKSLTELSQRRFFQNLSFVANASYIFSDIDLGNFVVVDPLISSTPLPTAGLVDRNRPMQNQSPYLINGGAYYNDAELGLQVNVLYNVFGKRVFAVGSLENPTIYEMPRNVLDFNVTKSVGQKLDIRFSAQDVLNNPVRLEQDFNRDGNINGSD